MTARTTHFGLFPSQQFPDNPLIDQHRQRATWSRPSNKRYSRPACRSCLSPEQMTLIVWIECLMWRVPTRFYLRRHLTYLCPQPSESVMPLPVMHPTNVEVHQVGIGQLVRYSARCQLLNIVENTLQISFHGDICVTIASWEIHNRKSERENTMVRKRNQANGWEDLNCCATSRLRDHCSTVRDVMWRQNTPSRDNKRKNDFTKKTVAMIILHDLLTVRPYLS